MPNVLDHLYGTIFVQSTALENSHIIITPTTRGFGGPFDLLSLTVLNYDTATGYTVMLFDSTTVPANGAVQPKFYFPVDPSATNGAASTSLIFSSSPAKFTNGIVVLGSSVITTPFTLTLATTNLLAFEAQVSV